MKHALHIAAVVVVAAAGSVHADITRKVAVDSDPRGAAVYVGQRRGAPACRATPCTIDAPVGEATLIVELAQHATRYELIAVPARGPVAKVSFKLALTLGAIVVDGIPGAEVSVDDHAVGAVPVRVMTSQDSHHVVVTLGGAPIYDEIVDVIAENTTTVTLARSPPPADDRLEVIEPSAPVPRPRQIARARVLQASAAIDVGFRRVTYAGVETPQRLRDESEAGQVLAGPIVEVWPGELAGISALRGLSLLARLQLGINSDSIMGNGLADRPRTSWRSTELSVRERITLLGRLSIELGAGYVRDRYRFTGAAEDLMLVPDADYQSIRIGARSALRLGRFEPYLAVEDRIVEAGGKLATRFARGDARGMRGALGLDARFGAITARIEGALTRYRWDFTSDPTSELRATGATDAIRQLQLAVGYQY